MGYPVKASTTSEHRVQELRSIKVEPCVVNIDQLSSNIQSFLESRVLIINIPSKNVDGFRKLLVQVEKSRIEKVLFVSSTSVYQNNNVSVSECDGLENESSPLWVIENLFRNSTTLETTILRFGGLIGYSRNPARFFSHGRPVQYPDTPVNLIHRDDCLGIISEIIRQQAWGEVFNACADTHPSKRAFYSHAAKSSGLAIPEFAYSKVQPYKIISNEKVKKFLNYEFLYPDLMTIEF